MQTSRPALLLLALLCTSGAVSTAAASSSAWHETEGARVRIVTTGEADSDGRLRGALQIDLEPGWKTYWRDPGGSGVPPTLDVSGSTNVTSVEISFPAPMRFDDGSATWAGYGRSVAFPLTFTLAAPDQPTLIKGDLFLGVCQEVCVPLQAALEVEPQRDAADPDDAAVVMAAEAALPAADGAATLASADDQAFVVRIAAAPDLASAELFVAGTEGYVLGTPERKDDGDGVAFVVPILEKPATRPASGGLPYTLVTDQRAVAGVLPFP